MTKFFEPISASATHVYHSALELCPESSIVRRLYYHRSSRITRPPRVVVGIPESWDPTVSISSKDDYKFCIWSPCGRFIAGLAGNVVEIRNQLTFELITTFQLTETSPLLVGPLAYSSDGRSLACASEAAIMVWDIQTGGMAREVKCRGARTISLVWSLDGRTIGTLESLSPDTGDTKTHVNTYDVASSAPLFVETIDSNHKPHLWAYNESFRVMTTEQYPHDHTMIEIQIKVFEVQSLLVMVNTFNTAIFAQAADVSIDYTPGSEIISFCPATCHVSISVGGELFIFQDQSPVPVFVKKGHFCSPCFSSDGSLFAASKDGNVYIWQHTSCRYVQWKEFRCQDWIDSQFSPTPSSFLTYSKNILQVWSLHDLPANPIPYTQWCAALSRSGNRIATTRQFETTITIIDPHVQSTSQRIHTGVRIEGLLLTSNILLVVGPDQVLSWRLTEEEPVDDGFDDRSSNQNDRLWTIPLSPLRLSLGRELEFKVEDQIGVIRHGKRIFLYHTATGKGDPYFQTPTNINDPGLNITGGLSGRHHAYCHNLPPPDTTPGSWYPSETSLREGWVKDPEGRCRLWLHVEWRKSWDLADWCHDIKTQFSIVGGQPIIVKF